MIRVSVRHVREFPLEVCKFVAMFYINVVYRYFVTLVVLKTIVISLLDRCVSLYLL